MFDSSYSSVTLAATRHAKMEQLVNKNVIITKAIAAYVGHSTQDSTVNYGQVSKGTGFDFF